MFYRTLWLSFYPRRGLSCSTTGFIADFLPFQAISTTGFSAIVYHRPTYVFDEPLTDWSVGRNSIHCTSFCLPVYIFTQTFSGVFANIYNKRTFYSHCGLSFRTAHSLWISEFKAQKLKIFELLKAIQNGILVFSFNQYAVTTSALPTTEWCGISSRIAGTSEHRIWSYSRSVSVLFQ